MIIPFHFYLLPGAETQRKLPIKSSSEMPRV